MPLYARLVYENRISASPDVDDVVHLVGPFENNEDLMKWYNSILEWSHAIKKVVTVHVDKLDDFLPRTGQLIVDNVKFGWAIIEVQ